MVYMAQLRDQNPFPSMGVPNLPLGTSVTNSSSAYQGYGFSTPGRTGPTASLPSAFPNAQFSSVTPPSAPMQAPLGGTCYAAKVGATSFPSCTLGNWGSSRPHIDAATTSRGRDGRVGIQAQGSQALCDPNGPVTSRPYFAERKRVSSDAHEGHEPANSPSESIPSATGKTFSDAVPYIIGDHSKTEVRTPCGATKGFDGDPQRPRAKRRTSSALRSNKRQLVEQEELESVVANEVCTCLVVNYASLQWQFWMATCDDPCSCDVIV